MCGIITYISKNTKNKTQAKDVIYEQFKNQIDRGVKGFGLIQIKENNYSVKKAVELEDGIKLIKSINSPIAVFHHRQPTSTENILSQAHPFIISHKSFKYNWIIVHNGGIFNCDELKKKHKKLGFKYKSEVKDGKKSFYNDSEAGAIELALYFETQNLKETNIEAYGRQAYVAIAISKEKEKRESFLLATKMEIRPLEVVETDDYILIASSIKDKNKRVFKRNEVAFLNFNYYFKMNKAVLHWQQNIMKQKKYFTVYPTLKETILSNIFNK